MTTFRSLQLIDPKEIRANKENPRVHFPQITMDSLAESIDNTGVLVPLAVYEDAVEGEPPYVLIDGERRWKCALRLGLDAVPANVLDEPDDVKNLLTMFHIHNVREPWMDMPTARALGLVMNRTGVTSVDELHQMTGLSKLKIKQYQHALELPPEYQELIENQQVPLNYFVELRKHLISPLKRRRPVLFEELGEKGILDAFVQKRLNGVNTDTVELRNASQIVNVAFQAAGGETGETDLDNVIRDLVQKPMMTVSEAYENSVEMVVEAGRFAQQCMQLVQKYDRLMVRIEDEAEEAVVREAVRKLIAELTVRLGGEPRLRTNGS